MIDLKDAVKDNATFQYYRDNALWYATSEGKLFPVPIEDAGSATFNRIEKGMYLMRWMRKWNDSNGGELKYSESEEHQ